MPYKDKDTASKAAAERMRRMRSKDVTPDTIKAVTPKDSVTPIVTPDGWPDVQAYIQRDSPSMPNLERLQRISGSLGKYAGDAWFGISGLTMEDIGSVIGTSEGKYAL